MKAKRILSLILAAIMLCSCFLFGCGKKDEGGKQNGGIVELETEGEDESRILDLETVDLKGHNFHFKARKVNHIQLETHEIYAENITGDDKINDAVFNRNAAIMEEYNCKITEEQVASPVSAYRENLLAGDYVADFFFDEARLLRTLAADNLLVDISTTENIDLTKAWWDQNSLNGMNIGNKIFFIVGDAATMDDRASWILWFNKDHIENYDSSIDLYQEVRDGKWTISRLYELMVETVADENGDGALMPGEDRMGYIAERYCNFGHVLACGVTMGNVDDAGNWIIPTEPKQELMDVWSDLRALITAPEREVSANIQNFNQGLGTFYSGNLGTAFDVRESTYRIGALPMPKRNEQQSEYMTGVYYSQLVAYAIPITVNNADDLEGSGFESGVERSAYFLEVFSYYSMNILTPAFYNQVLLKQSVSDQASAEMIELAMENKVYDPIAGYNFGSINIYSLVGSNNQNGIPGTDVNYDTFKSTYESRVNAARKALENYINFINVGDVIA
ncbi:MAG: hypothetical protein IKC69_02985 [Clostridia bacterium]|nr:hypothetical protein [Clostridia bacterium]